MTNDEFTAWRARHFRSRRACARAFGVGIEVVECLERGRQRDRPGKEGRPYPVPPTIELTCAAWTMGIRAYDGGPVTIG